MPTTSMTTAATVTTTKQITLKPQVRRKLLTELRAYAELAAQRDAIDLAMSKHKAAIGKIREETGEKSLALEGFKVTLVEGVTKTLDKLKLIAMGVTTTMLDEATTIKPKRAYEKISLPGEKGAEDE